MTTLQELENLREKLTTKTEPAATLGGMNDLAEKLAALREDKRIAEEQVSKISGELEDLQKRLIDLMMQYELTTYKAPSGTISITHHFTAKLPQGEDKVTCFEYLKSIGRFEDMASIHSQTFNSWVKEQYDLARERGEDEPKLPGVTDVKTLLRISFRRTK